MKRALLTLLAAGGLILAGCQSTGAGGRESPPTLARFFLETSSDRAGAIQLPRSGVQVAVGARPVLTEGDIANVEVVQVDLGKCLMFQLTPDATRDLYRLSAAHQGRRIVVTIDGLAVGARRIEAPLANGVIYVFVELPDEELPALVAKLKETSTALQRAKARS